MKTNLEILIDELQTECDFLQKEIDLCVKDSDFEGAHAFNKSLTYTQQQLRILQNIQNPSWDEIRWIKHCIKQLKKFKGNEYTAKQLIDYQLKLDRLQATQSKKYPLESEEIVLALEKLSKGKITKINLQIGGGHDVEIHFKLHKKALHFQLITDRRFRKGNAILRNLGFEIRKNDMFLQIPDFDLTKISKVLEILAQIIYEVLGLRGNENAKIIIS